MKRMFVCLLFLTTFSTYANAQEIPVAEYFGGYSYSSVKPDFLAERGERAWLPCGHRPEYETVRDRPRRHQQKLRRVSRNELEYDNVPVRAAFYAPRQERHVVCSVALRVLLNQRGRRCLRPRDRALRFEFRVRAGRRRDRCEAEREDRSQSISVRPAFYQLRARRGANTSACLHRRCASTGETINQMTLILWQIQDMTLRLAPKRMFIGIRRRATCRSEMCQMKH